MKKFRMKQPKYLIALFSVCVAVELYLLVLSILWLTTTPVENTSRFCTLILFIVLILLSLSICLGSLIYPCYSVKKGKLKLILGIIFITYDLSDVSEIIYFKDKEKLVMYYGEKFIIILLPRQKHDAFVKSLREINPSIIYDNKVSENN